jgi:hypothetical protein
MQVEIDRAINAFLLAKIHLRWKLYMLISADSRHRCRSKSGIVCCNYCIFVHQAASQIVKVMSENITLTSSL